VTGFSNAEEPFLISNARSIFPFLLEDALANSAAYESARYISTIRFSMTG
jgi:hypothetical protein